MGKEEIASHQHMNNIYNRLVTICAFGVCLIISYIAVFYVMLSYDGAFNTQAAFNLYNGNGLRLDYLPQAYLQTNLPFQGINGFLLTLFGRSFIASHAANLLFYWLFFWFALVLSKRSSSPLPLVAFIVVSLQPLFLAYGFGGLGNVPSLMFALTGIYIVIQRHDDKRMLIFGAALIALSPATKWIQFLVLVPLLPVSMIFILQKKYDVVYTGAIVIAAVFSICYFVQYQSYQPMEMEILDVAIGDSINAAHQSTWSDRMTEFMQSYVKHAGLSFFAWLKLFLAALLGITLIYQFSVWFAGKTKGYPLKNTDMLFMYLSLLTLTYLVCWFFLITESWYHRVYYSDILIFLSLSLVPYALRNTGYRAFATYLVIVVFSVFTLGHIVMLYNSRGDILSEYSNIELEKNLRRGLSLLPEEFSGCGYKELQAPRWSFISGRAFKDILLSTVMYDHYYKGIPAYIFLEMENSSDTSMLDVYDLEEIFAYDSFRILRVGGFNMKNAQFVSKIDFSEGDLPGSTVGVWPNKNSLEARFLRDESAFFLDNEHEAAHILIDFNVRLNVSRRVFKGMLFSDSSSQIAVYDIPFNIGENSAALKIPPAFGRHLVLYLSQIKRDESDFWPRGFSLRRVEITNGPSGQNILQPVSVNENIQKN